MQIETNLLILISDKLAGSLFKHKRSVLLLPFARNTHRTQAVMIFIQLDVQQATVSTERGKLP